MANPEILVEIGATIEGLKKVLLDAEGKLKGFGDQATKIGTALSLALTTPLLLIGRASLRAASDAEETASKFETVFSSISGQAQESFKSLRNEYGLSSTASKQLLGDTGDLLAGFGFSQDSALDLATQVAKLGVDLASFTNFSGGAKGASEALTKALLGERESVKALGIAILDEDVKKQVAINTAKGLTFETERQAQAYATLDIALAQSKNSIGDFSRTSDQFANQQRIASERIQEVSESLGKVFLPLATKVAGIITDAANSFNELSDSTKETVVILAVIAASFGPLLLGIGAAIKLLPVLIAGYAGFGKALTAATGPIGLLVIAIAAAAFIIISNWDEIKKTFDDTGITDSFNEIIKNVKEFISILSGNFKTTFEGAKKDFLEFLQIIKPVAVFIKDELIKNIKLFLDVISQSFNFIINLANGDFSSAFLNLEIIFLSLSKRIIEAIKPLFEFIGLGDQFDKVLKNIDKTISDNKAILAGREAYKSYNNAIKETAESIDKVTESTKKAKQTLEQFSALADIANIKVFEQFDKDATEFNNTLKETISLQQRLFSAESGLKAKSIPGIIDVDTKIDGPPVIEIPDIDESSKSRFLSNLQEFSQNINDILKNNIASAFSDLGTNIGQALATGANVISEIGKSLLNSIGSFLGDLGQQLIAYGVAGLSFGILTEAITKGGPLAIPAAIGAIAAGTALMAISGSIKSLAGKRSGMSSGGGGGGGMGAGSSFTGSGGMAFAGSRDINLMGSFRIDGNDLLYVIDRTKEGRI